MSLTPEQILTSLKDAYRAVHVRWFGAENGLPVADDALKTVMLGRLTAGARDIDKRGPIICAGEHVLAWPRGYLAGKVGETPRRAYVAWHPSMGRASMLIHTPALEEILV